MCEKAGIRVVPRRYAFAVITCIVKGGYDAAGFSIPAPDDNKRGSHLSDFIRVNQEDRSVTLNLPEPTVVDIVVEDSTESSYPYPALNVSPEQWKLMTAFVTERIRRRVIEDGILENAEARAREFITAVLLQSGFSAVYFTKAEDA